MPWKRSDLSMLIMVVLCLAMLVTSAHAQEDEPYLKHRQSLMSAIGGHMGAIGTIAKSDLPFMDAIAVHAKSIEMSAGLIEKAFEKEITEGKTDAKPDIWQDRDKFVAAAKAMQEEAGKLAGIDAGDKGAIVAQIKALGDACGDCHKPFRKPKEERFKR
jgi:cytochrome c556